MMRHAESEERLQSIRDHDRPITDGGRSSAREVLCCPCQEPVSGLVSLCTCLSLSLWQVLRAQRCACHAAVAQTARPSCRQERGWRRRGGWKDYGPSSQRQISADVICRRSWV